MRIAWPLALICTVLIAAPAEAATATWKRLSTGGPSARSDAAIATGDGSVVYVHGGQRNGRALGDLWLFYVKDRRWRRVPTVDDGPGARFGHDMVVARDGTLLLFGGQAGDRFFGDVWAFDPKRGFWFRSAHTGPAPRYGAGVAFDRPSNTLLITHGFTSKGRFDDTWGYDWSAGFTDLSTPAGARPLQRCLVSAAVHGGGLFMFGGQSDSRPFLDDLWRYDMATRTWAALTARAKPSARHSYGSARVGARWVVHGGATHRGPARDLWTLDLARPTSFARVKVRGRSPGAVADQAMVGLSRTRALIFGGSAEDGRGRRETWLLRVP